jgi:hypothetical protein
MNYVVLFYRAEHATDLRRWLQKTYDEEGLILIAAGPNHWYIFKERDQ